MPYSFHTIPSSLDKILVIDEMPLVSLAFQEVFRTVNTAATVAYTENIFTALSSGAFDQANFDLVITGAVPDHFSQELRLSVTELKEKFPNTRIMIYSIAYDPSIIEKMEEAGIDAYVHKYEPLDEIRKAYTRLSSGQPHVSEIFRTLYHEYGLHLDKMRSIRELTVAVTTLQQQILILICEGKTTREVADTLSVPHQEVVKELACFITSMKEQ